MTGITWITAFALLAGLLVHTLKDYKAAHANGVKLPLGDYVVGEWIDTLSASVMAIACWLGQPELVDKFPDFASGIGLGPTQTIMSSLAIGYMSNSLVGVLGNRSKLVAGIK